MLHVALYLADQNPHRDRSLGITRATRSIADALRDKVELTQVVSASSVTLPEQAVRATIRLPFSTDRTPGRLAADVLHPALARVPADVWFYPKGYAASPFPTTAPVVALVHDTILVHYARTYPEARSRLDYAYWLAQLRRTLRRADRIATVSNTARGQIEAFCVDERIPLPPIDVVFAATAFDEAEPEAPTSSPYVLHFASDAPHKRTAWLVDAWQHLSATRDLPILRLLGPLPPGVLERVGTLPHVEALPRVSDVVLTKLLREAAAVVVPSEIEGFGLPVLEAYASGTPVCFTEGTALAEVAGIGTPRGAFALDGPDGLGDALDDVLSMTPGEIRAIQRVLAGAFTSERLGERVEASLRAAAA